MPVSDQGSTQNRYSLIPRTLIFLTREEKVLLIKGSPQKRLWANLYNGIGGHIEPSEDVRSAARRELKEETDLEPDELWLCGTITIDTGHNPGIGIFIFRGECSKGSPRESPEGLAEWIPIQALDEYPLVEDLETILPEILKLTKGDPILSVSYTYNLEDQLVIRFGG